jgi:hypothetical protein
LDTSRIYSTLPLLIIYNFQPQWEMRLLEHHVNIGQPLRGMILAEQFLIVETT